MDSDQLYEKVTARISLDKKKHIEASLKKACKDTKVEYHEAAEYLFVTGTLDELIHIKNCITKNDVNGSERSGSNSTAYYDTQPYLAAYVQNIHNGELKSIEQQCNVAITWTADGTKVKIKASGTAGNNQHFKLACEKFIEMYKYLYQSVMKVSFDVKKEEKRFGKGTLENAVCSVPQNVPGLLLEKAADGRTYTIWGTNTSLANGQEWIRRQLGIPSGLKTRSQSSNVLTHETANKLKVVVYEGDITLENTDIIVNASNEHLDHGGGVSFAIAKAAGPSLQHESDNYVKKHGALSTGDVAVTGSGSLKCKNVLHAVGPQWKKHGKDKSIKYLQTIFSEVYRIALKLNAKSVAMPAISSGIYGVPKDVCAKTIFSFVDELDQKLSLNNTGPFEIRLVNIDVETVQVFCQEFHKWLLKGKKVERRHSFNSGIKEEPEKQPARNRSADDTHMPPEIKGSLLVTAKFQNVSSRSNASTTQHTTSVTRKLPNPSSPSGQQQSQQENLSATSATHGMESNRKSGNGRPLPNPSSSSMSARNIPVVQNGLDSQAKTQGKTSNKDCPICQSTMTNPKVLSKCGHSFCTPCIDKAFTYKKKCPICQVVYGITEGDQPDGTMTVDLQSHGSLSGYEGRGFYSIRYNIPSGKQDNRHPNPGKWFAGTVRHAYLPATKEGKVVLELLRKAFDKKLTFTVGRSTTTGKEDCVTWNDIHHKTNITGGPQRFGYPDPDYLRRVKDELKAKGIVPD